MNLDFTGMMQYQIVARLIKFVPAQTPKGVEISMKEGTFFFGMKLALHEQLRVSPDRM